MSEPKKTQGKATTSSAKDWKKLLYTEERVTKWAKGEMTLAELDGVSGPEMMEMAITGFSMYEQGRYREAKVIFDGLAALDPTESYYRTALGAVFLAQEQLDQALAQFDKALELNAKDVAALVNRGEVRLRKGQLFDAAEDFKHAVDLDPENKDPLSLRARALAAAALETLEKRGLASNLFPGADKAPKKPGLKK